jgi:nitroimidazol reductase NimA-like FMN-containing flavoprotein (pyridoxamine 5'-phosphate oxidase superfamily)
MEREMRRKDRLLSFEEAEKILAQGEYGILSLAASDGAYGVPMSYRYADGKILLHCAPVGRKLDAIKENPNVCFTVVGHTRVIPERFTTEFESAIAFGRAEILTGEASVAPVTFFSQKYSGDADASAAAQKYAGRFVVIQITVEHLTGKGLKA